MYIYIYIYILLISKFGGCKRQDSPAKRTPRTNGKFSRRCARHGVRENPESAIDSCLPVSVRPCVRACACTRANTVYERFAICLSVCHQYIHA